MFNNPKGSWSNQVMGFGVSESGFSGKRGFIFDVSGEQWRSHCSRTSKIKGGGYAKLVRQTDRYFPPPIVKFLSITFLFSVTCFLKCCIFSFGEIKLLCWFSCFLRSFIFSLEKSSFSDGLVAFWRGYAAFWFSGFWALFSSLFGRPARDFWILLWGLVVGCFVIRVRVDSAILSFLFRLCCAHWICSGDLCGDYKQQPVSQNKWGFPHCLWVVIVVFR